MPPPRFNNNGIQNAALSETSTDNTLLPVFFEPLEPETDPFLQEALQPGNMMLALFSSLFQGFMSFIQSLFEQLGIPLPDFFNNLEDPNLEDPGFEDPELNTGNPPSALPPITQTPATRNNLVDPSNPFNIFNQTNEGNPFLQMLVSLMELFAGIFKSLFKGQ